MQIICPELLLRTSSIKQGAVGIPGGPVVRTAFTLKGPRSIPAPGTKISQDTEQTPPPWKAGSRKVWPQTIDYELRVFLTFLEAHKTVSCHPVCLTYTLSTSWEMPGWKSYKLELR